MTSDRPAPRRVFLSYTAEDLLDHANAARDALSGTGYWAPVDHRLWPATGQPSVAECRRRVEGCAAMIALVAHRYGCVPTKAEGGDGERSFVWLEIDAALKRGIPVLPLLVDEDALWLPKHMDRDSVAVERLTRLRNQLGATCRALFSDAASVEREVLRLLPELKERLDADAPRAGSAPRGAAAPPADAIADYRARTAERFRRIELLGFGEQFQIDLPIDQLYVPLRFSLGVSFGADPRDAKGRATERLAAEAEAMQRGIPIERAFVRAAERQRRGIVLLGDPGSGKTTALRRLCWQAADALHGPATLGLPDAMVPVHLRLRRVRRADLDRNLVDFLAEDLRSPHLDHADATVRALCERAPLLWLLDGLDEIADRQLRADVAGWIRAALDARPRDVFAVSCRYAGWHKEARLGASFLELDVEPLDDALRKDFVETWYRTVERAVRGPGPATESHARERAADLLQVLGGRDFSSLRLASMAGNPLLISILCIVHRKDLELPRRRAELYDKCIQVLLEHWRHEWRKDQGVARIDVAAARSVLQSFAWWLHQEQDRSDAESDACAAEVARSLATVAADAGLGVDGLAFLERVRDESGLVVNPNAGRFAFLHPTFQEYLTARYACELGLAQDLAGQSGVDWWREVALLALSQGPLPFAEEYFARVLARAGCEQDSEFLARAIQETLHVPSGALAQALAAPGAPVERLRLLLRWVGQRPVEALLDALTPLVEHSDDAVAGEVRAILERAGRSVRRAERESQIRVRVSDPSGAGLVRIPKGTYLRGSKEWTDSQPVVRIAIEEFWLARTPVTNAQYARFLKDEPKQEPPRYWRDSKFNRPEQPVVGVTWDDAIAFCCWAGLRLPSEAEWEYACRAGSDTAYWPGDGEDDLKRVGWYDGNSEGRLHDVAEKPGNGFGLDDMHGNVWEWCQDRWHDSYKGAPVDASAWEEGASEHRVIRGGSFGDAARYARSACRSRGGAGNRWNLVGFRPAL